MSRYNGIIIFTKQFEEKGTFITYLTNLNLIKTSLVRGIKKKQQIVQIGNVINFEQTAREGLLGIINPEIEKSFNAVLSIEKESCGILYCLTFLIYSLFRYETSYKINLYLLIYNYFDSLSQCILNSDNYQLSSDNKFNYFDIEKIIINNAGWLEVNNTHLQEKDLIILFQQLNIKNDKFFFYRKLLNTYH